MRNLIIVLFLSFFSLTAGAGKHDRDEAADADAKGKDTVKRVQLASPTTQILNLPDDVFALILQMAVGPEMHQKAQSSGVIVEGRGHMSYKEGTRLSSVSRHFRRVIQGSFLLHTDERIFTEDQKQEATNYLQAFPQFFVSFPEMYAIHYTGPYVPELTSIPLPIRRYHLLTALPLTEAHTFINIPYVRSASFGPNVLGDKEICYLISPALIQHKWRQLSLDVTGCDGEPDTIISLADAFKRGDQLASLTIKGQSIQPELNELFAAIYVNNTLKVLNLDNTNAEDMSPKGIQALTHHFPHMKSITELSLRSQYLNCVALRDLFEPFMQALFQMPSLTSLDLTDNFIGPRELEILARYLLQSPSLRTLNFAQNPIGDEGAQLLEQVLKGMPDDFRIVVGSFTPDLKASWEESNVPVMGDAARKRLKSLAPKIIVLPDEQEEAENESEEETDLSGESQVSDLDDESMDDSIA